MPRDIGRAIVVTLLWVAVTLGCWFILNAVLPGLPPMVASLWIIAALSVLLLIGVSWAGWWHAIGYAGPAKWRARIWLLLPLAVALVPLAAGIRPLTAETYGLLLAGYALTGFAEETMFRGVLVRLLEQRSPLAIAGLTAVLFGLVHLSNVFIRGEPAIIAAQAVGAAAFGFGYGAIRLRTGTLVPLIVAHMLTDLFLQMGNLPLIPVAVVEDVILFAAGLWLLRRPLAQG